MADGDLDDCEFCEGSRAYTRGEAITANPYPRPDVEGEEPSQWFLWDTGWRSEKIRPEL